MIRTLALTTALVAGMPVLGGGRNRHTERS